MYTVLQYPGICYRGPLLIKPLSDTLQLSLCLILIFPYKHGFCKFAVTDIDFVPTPLTDLISKMKDDPAV